MMLYCYSSIQILKEKKDIEKDKQKFIFAFNVMTFI